MIKVVFFYRKPFKDYHSIENLFSTIQVKLPKSIIIKKYTLSRFSAGLFNRIASCFEVIKKQEDINHITGDVHFISYFLKKKKTVLTIHDLVPLENSLGIKRFILSFFWYRLPIYSVDFVTVISNFTKEELLKEFKVNPSKIKVIKNPVSDQFKYTQKQFNKEKPILFQIGTAENKNLEGLIKAIRTLKVELYILGSLSIAQKNLLNQENIEYKNFKNLKFEEVIALYKKVDIICFASLYEGFGLPIVEGQATGRPVITSSRCSMPEVAGEGALFIDPNSTKEYRNAINSLLVDKSLRDDLIQKGLKNVKRFSNQKCSDEYYQLYKKIWENQN